MRRSLRLLVAATTSAVALSLLIPLSLLVRTLAEDRAIQAANDAARTFAAVVATLPGDAGEGEVVSALEQASPLLVTVRLPDGRVVRATGERGTLGSAAESQLDRAAAGESFSTREQGNPVIYVPAVTAGGTAVVRVEVPDAETSRGVGVAVATLAVLGLAMLVVAVAVADTLARRLSAPLVGIAETARRHRSGDLAARAPERGPPEVVDVGRALNELAVRVEELLVAEREAVADLAHRLRTPVTALRLAGEQVPDPVGERVRGYVDDLERAVDGLVRDARRPVRSAMSARCDAAAVAAERVAYWTPLAEDRGVRLTVTAGSPAVVAVDGQELADVLDALLDNAFAHAGEELRRVEVAVEVGGSVTTVAVADDGRGLPPVVPTERGHSGSGSTGLGLDIARRTAEAAGGALRTGTSGLGGAYVAVALRTAPA